ncbi:MAG TPA: RNA polymerase sigma-70 factor [Chitinophagaceae bacterium]
MPVNHELYSTFEKLFREHYNALANYAYTILKNKENAEDIVQDVFIRLWHNSPAVIETPEVKFYLLTATKNACISFLRKESGRTFVQPEDVRLATIPDARPTDSGETDYASIVTKALSALPPQCLAIFKLSRFGKLTYQQIADELGLSVKTVENQMGKALRIMREYARMNNISFAILIFILFPDLCPLTGIA